MMRLVGQSTQKAKSWVGVDQVPLPAMLRDDPRQTTKRVSGLSEAIQRSPDKERTMFYIVYRSKTTQHHFYSYTYTRRKKYHDKHE